MSRDGRYKSAGPDTLSAALGVKQRSGEWCGSSVDATQHLAEGEVESAELRLSGMLIGVVVGVVIVLLARSQIVLGVPDGVR